VYFDNHGKPCPLAFLPETKVPFVVLENVEGVPLAPAWNSDNSNTFPNGLHVVRFEDRDSVIKIGRGHDCDMRISDVSISRLHAEIRMDPDGSLLLIDKQSKFGTLLDTERHALIVSESGLPALAVQSGRTVVELAVGPEEDVEVAEEERPHTH